MPEKISTVFAKTGDMIFISHLDLMRLFQRAARRAALPVTITKGFSPHLKMSLKRALKLGVESREEEAVFHIDRVIAPECFEASINKQLPDGVRVISAKVVI